MIINQETDYAIRIVHCLAESPQRLGAAVIARSTGVTQGFTLKILRKLLAAGLVVSVRGAAGGYTLARPPEEITLGQVIGVISGPTQFSHCQGETTVCTHPAGVCYFKDVFDDVARYMEEQFRQATFAPSRREK